MPASFHLAGTSYATHAEYGRRILERIETLGDRVAYHGVVSDPFAFLAGLDLSVISSGPRSEGIPTTIVESLAVGTPVVSTNVGAISDLLLLGPSGILVRPERPVELAEGIRALCSDEFTRRQLSMNGRSIVAEFCNPERLARDHSEVFRAVLDRRET